MSGTHSHGAEPGQNEKPLWFALALTGVFLIAEVVGGILTNSLALISDAAHMFTDAAALAVSLAAMRIGRRPADGKRTFGYYRFEILAASFNAILLFLVAMYILYEAYERIGRPAQIESTTMLIIAALGMVVNLISMRLLSKDKDSSLNIKGAYLEVWSDMLGSIGVIVGAVVIKLTGWSWVDSVLAVAIGLWVLPRTWVLLKESVNVLLEGVPEGVGVEDIKGTLLGIKGIFNVHELHVWAISSGKTSLTVHIASRSPPDQWPQLTEQIHALLVEKFDIVHATIQLENAVCAQGISEHSYRPKHLEEVAGTSSVQNINRNNAVDGEG